MPNYQNGKIYMIESLEGKCRYYGSTVQKLCVRLSEHRRNYKRETGKFTSKKVLCYNDAKILLVENYPCNSKEELYMKEGYYIRNNECVNRCIAGRKKEERVSEKIPCECGVYVRYNGLARHKKTKKHMKLMEKNNL